MQYHLPNCYCFLLALNDLGKSIGMYGKQVRYISLLDHVLTKNMSLATARKFLTEVGILSFIFHTFIIFPRRHYFVYKGKKPT